MRIHVALVKTSRKRVKLQLQTRAGPSQEQVYSRLKTLSVLLDPVFKSIPNVFSCLFPAPPPATASTLSVHQHWELWHLFKYQHRSAPRSPLTSQKNTVEYNKSLCLHYQLKYEIKVRRAVSFLPHLDDEAPLRGNASVELLVETKRE